MKGPSIKTENEKTYLMLGNKKVMECGGLIKEAARIRREASTINKEDFKMKFKCERWAVIDKKSGKELGTLGWYSPNTTKKEVIAHVRKDGIKIEEGEDIKVVEEY